MSEENEGNCVWYGVCYRNETFKTKIKNCAYDGPPKALDSIGVEKLALWCPDLMSPEGNDILTCCDNDQVNVHKKILLS